MVAAIRGAAALAVAMFVTLPVAPALAAGPDTAHRPAPPTDLRVPALANDESSITLVWDKPADHAAGDARGAGASQRSTDIVDYHVYQDGTYAGSANEHASATSPAKPYIDAFYADPVNRAQVKVVMNTFTATGLAPSTRHRFTVRAVDSNGVESRDSVPVHASTTAVPTVVDVTAFGAVGDGTTVNTAAIQAAIDATPPGGKTLIPAGVFVSGAIWLHSDMTLQVADGATLLGSANADDYPWNYKLYDYSTDTRFYSLINAHTYDYGTLRNIRIVGPGTIDGNGWKRAGVDAEGFPVSAPSSSSTVSTNGILAAAQVVKATALGSPSPYGTRSNLITLRGVDNVYYGNFTALNPSQHTLVNLRDHNVTVNGVKLLTYNVNNADGIEFTNSDGLTVVNTLFDTGDDDMNFAAGLGAQSTDDPPSTHAWISNNYFRKGHGAVVEGSHTGAWIENIVAEDNVINGTDVALRMKTDPNNGGGSRHVLFRDNAVRNVGQQAFIFTSAYSDPNAAIVVEPAATKAQFRDVHVEHVTVDGTGRESINVIGVSDQPHTQLHFDDVRFLNAKPTSIQYLTDSTFHDVVFDNTAQPWVIGNATGLSFTGSTTQTGVSTDASATPSWPAGSALTVGPATDTSVTLSWPAAADNVGVATYRILRDGNAVASVAGGTLSATVTGLAPAQSHRYQVVAVDATGNASRGNPTTDAATTGTPDTQAPAAPAGGLAVVANGVGTTWLKLKWAAATDDYGVDHYVVSVGGSPVATVDSGQTSYTVTRLRAGTTYQFALSAVDGSGNSTPYPGTVSATTNPPYDTGVPDWPRGARVSAASVGATSVTLRWPAATDDRQVAGYRIYVDGRPVTNGQAFTPIDTAATTSGLTWTVTGLAPGTRYTFTVQAGDTAGKWTGSGPSVVVTTKRS